MKLQISLLLFALCAGGCSTYRVSSNVEAVSPAQRTVGAILLYQDKQPSRAFETLGPIEVTVNKGSVFTSAPTQVQADAALIQKARDMGAQAVMGIRYESSFNVMSGGYIKANGTGICFTE